MEVYVRGIVRQREARLTEANRPCDRSGERPLEVNPSMFLHPRTPSTIGNASHGAGMEWWLQRMFDVSSENRSLAAGGLAFSRNRCIQVQFPGGIVNYPGYSWLFIPSILLVRLLLAQPTVLPDYQEAVPLPLSTYRGLLSYFIESAALLLFPPGTFRSRSLQSLSTDTPSLSPTTYKAP